MTWAETLRTAALNGMTDIAGHPVRIAVLVTAILMTLEVSRWSMWFAIGNARPGLEIAAILAAVQAPVTLFAGTVFRAYLDSKKEQ